MFLYQHFFCIFFSMLYKYASKDCSEYVYTHNRANSKLYNLSRIHAKTKVIEILIQELLLPDNAALTSQSVDCLPLLVSHLSHIFKEFGLPTRLKKTNIMAQGPDTPPNITMAETRLEIVDSFTYLWCL